MLEAQFSIFDSIVLAVVGLSALIAFFRGFMKEVLSLGAWIGAAIITIYAFPYVTEYLKPHFSSELVATGLATLGTYIVALLVISIFNGLIIRYFKTGAEVGLIDNFLGLLFGVARGAFIVCLGFMVAKFVMFNGDNYPESVTESRTFPAVKYGTELMAQVAPQYLESLDDMSKNAKDSMSNGAQILKNKGNELERDIDPALDSARDSMSGGVDSVKQGYNRSQRQDLNRVIDSIDGNQ